MLQRLYIQNYAIIDEVEIHFDNELNIITGETGAGKSILMGALSLILGQRADSSALLNREKKCVVEGFFLIKQEKKVFQFLHKQDLDAEEELVIRREIAINGKSRAFVNDTPVTVQQLQLLSTMLVDLHQQFDTFSLGEADFQRQVIDALAGNEDLLNQYQQCYYQLKAIEKEKADIVSRKEQFTREYDYNKFLLDELEEAAFAVNELEEAESELKLLSNSEHIKQLLQSATALLSEGEEPLAQQLKLVLNQLQPCREFHSKLPELLQRLQSVQIELDDISGEVEQLSQEINHDPVKIEKLTDRLSLGYKLLKKHQVKTTEALLTIKVQLQNKLQAVLDTDEVLNRLLAQQKELYQKALSIAQKLSQSRKKQLKPLEQKINALLAQVGMPNARLKPVVEEVENLNEYGLNEIDFLFNANLPAGEKGKEVKFEPVKKVASGGELSRLMLCIKSLVVQTMNLPTLIFDEIDTGISGEAARQVGGIMKELALGRQIICITHQPQIAGKASTHFLVYKEVKGSVVKTHIKPLSSDERITAIAKMLSGEKPTPAAIENAREMMVN
jgi:DNA repair protein RecN (Recombination protein N)